MNGKLVILFLVVAGLLAGLWRMSKRRVQGFQNPSEPTFTMYYAPWCGHCKVAKPEFDEFAKDGRVMVGGKKCVVRAVDATDPKNKAEASAKGVQGFPTFILETPSGEPKFYEGKRTTAGYLEFLNKELGGGV